MVKRCKEAAQGMEGGLGCKWWRLCLLIKMTYS